LVATPDIVLAALLAYWHARKNCTTTLSILVLPVSASVKLRFTVGLPLGCQALLLTAAGKQLISLTQLDKPSAFAYVVGYSSAGLFCLSPPVIAPPAL
jgi:hypothetical protein